MWSLTVYILLIGVGVSLQAECDITNNQGFCGAQCIEGFEEATSDTCAEGVCCYVSTCPFDQGAFCGPSCDVVPGYVDAGEPCVGGVCCMPENCPNGVCIPETKVPFLGPDFTEDPTGFCAEGDVCLVYENCEGNCIPADKLDISPDLVEDPNGQCILGEVCAIFVEPTTAVMETTEALVETTEALVETTEALVETTEALVETTEAAVETTEAAVETTAAAVETTEALVETTEALVETTEALVETTEAVEETTEAAVETTLPAATTTTAAVETTADTRCEGSAIDGLCWPEADVFMIGGCTNEDTTATDCKDGEKCCLI